MPTPEIPIDKQIVERPTEIASETLQQAGIQSTPANVQPVVNDQGQPIIKTPATQGGKIQIPSDTTSLAAQAKGSVTNAITWLAKFFLRLIAKQNANTTNTNTGTD